MAQHTSLDSRVHHRVLATIIERGHAPRVSELAAVLQQPSDAIEDSLHRLHDNHGLVLHPGTCEIWIAHPFSLSPTAVWLAAGQRGWSNEICSRISRCRRVLPGTTWSTTAP